MTDSGRATATLWVVVLLVGAAIVSVGAGVGTAVADDAAAASNEDDGDGWPMAGHGARGTGYAPDAEGPRTNLNVAWSYDANENATGSPAVVNDTAYLTDGENLTALNATTGEVEWTRTSDPQDPVTGTPAIAKGTVFATTEHGAVVARNATTGAKTWTLPGPDSGLASDPVVADGIIYFTISNYRDSTGLLVAADASDGEMVWSSRTRPATASVPVVSDRFVHFSGGQRGNIWTVDRRRGTLVERYPAGTEPTPPVLPARDTLLVGTADGLTSSDPAGDRVLTIDDRGVAARPVAAVRESATGDDWQVRYVAPGADGVVRALNGSDDLVWSHAGNESLDGQPAVTDDAVYVNDNGTLEALHPSNGSVLGTVAVGPGGSQPTVADGRAYARTGDGRLVAVSESPVDPGIDGPSTTVEDSEVTLDASPSTVSGGSIAEYEWDPDGDGEYEATGATLNWTFAHPGEREVGLRLTSEAGETNGETTTVMVRERVHATVAVNDTPAEGEAVELDAGGSTDAAGTELTYDWDIDADGRYEREGERVAVTYDEAGYQPVRLRVTAEDGLSDTNATRVYVAPRDGSSLLELYRGGATDVDMPDGELEPRWSTDDEIYYPRFAIAGNGTLYVTDHRQPPEERTGPLAYDIVAVDAGTGEVDWRTAAGSGLSPAATTASDRVYVGTTVGGFDASSTNLLAVDKSTGEVEWNLSVGPGSSYAPPIVDGDRVYAASSEVESRINGDLAYIPMTTVVATTPDRQEVWNRSVKGAEATVRLHDGRLYVAGDLGNVTALNATTGDRVWNASVDADSVGLRVRNGTALVVARPSFRDSSDIGTLTAFNAATGERAWNASLESIGQVRWSEDGLYATSGPNVTALNSTAGERVWNATVGKQTSPGRLSSGSATAIAFDDERVYALNQSGGVVALNATTGDERWRTKLTTATERPGRFLAADGQVFVDGEALVSLNATDGSVDGSYTYEQPRQFGGLVGAGGDAAFVVERYSMAALTSPEPGPIVASDLTVSASKVDAGEEITLNVTVENQGDAATTTDVPVTVDGTTVDTVSVTLASSEHRTVERTVTLNEAGERAVAIGGATPRPVSVAGEPDNNETDNADETESGTDGDDGAGGGGGGGQSDLPDPATTVSVEPADGGGETTVEVQAAQPNETVTVDLDNEADEGTTDDGTADDGTDGNATDDGTADAEDAAEVTAVEVVPAESGDYELTVNGTAAAPDDVPAPTANGSESVDYVVVDHDFADDAVESVTFSVTVSRERLDEMNAAPEDVRVRRYSDGNWTTLPTDVERETIAGYVVSARSPGLSAFAVTVASPALDVGEPSLNRTTVERGGSVGVSVPVSNDGGAAGTATVPVAVDGETVTTAEVTVQPGETRTATATVAFDEAGEVGVSVDGTDAGTVSVEAPQSTTTSTSVASTTTATPETTTAADGTTTTDAETSESTDSGGQPGFGPLVAVAALALWLARRR